MCKHCRRRLGLRRLDGRLAPSDAVRFSYRALGETGHSGPDSRRRVVPARRGRLLQRQQQRTNCIRAFKHIQILRRLVAPQNDSADGFLRSLLKTEPHAGDSTANPESQTEQRVPINPWKLNANWKSILRFPPPGGPNPPAREFDLPKRGELSWPTGAPKFTMLKAFRAPTPTVRL